jgi:hypothetical protein
MSSQPQLFRIAQNPRDVVYTPDWVVRDMVAFFQPSGRILEPCRGDGVFLEYLPGAEWCEIQKEKDFYAWNARVDWIMSNPPYTKYLRWLKHSLEIAEHIVYLIPCDYALNTMEGIKEVYQWGGIQHIRVYGDGRALGFPVHRPIGAVHYTKNYQGSVNISFVSDTGREKT